MESLYEMESLALDDDPNVEDEFAELGGWESTTDYQVIGRDERVRIRNTRRVPWRYVCKLQIVWPSGRHGGCTGALVAPNKVLTAAHCVYNRNTRRRPTGFARSIRVVPAKNGSAEPFGHTRALRIDVPRAWRRLPYRPPRDRAARRFDYAIITLARPIGKRTGWFPRIRCASRRTLLGSRLNTAGYPGDRGGRHLFWAFNRAVNVRANIVEYLHDTFGGQSGSPVWLKEGRLRTIVAIHTRRDDPESPEIANIGVRITPRVLREVRRWIRR